MEAGSLTVILSKAKDRSHPEYRDDIRKRVVVAASFGVSQGHPTVQPILRFT
jgi:hypothetical protein